MSVNFPIKNSQVSVQPPICAICTPGDEPRIVLVQKGKGIRHWPNEGHVTKRRDESRNNVTPVTELPPGSPQQRKGRPRKYKDRATQQASYRERKGDG